MDNLLLVLVFGGLGAVARFVLAKWNGYLPWGILLGNTIASAIAGCFGATSLGAMLVAAPAIMRAAGSGTRAAPWDVIMISGALPVLPRTLLEQLSIGGRLLAIIGEAPVMSACLFTRTAQDAWSETRLFETCIKPLRETEAPSAFHF